MLVIHMMQNNLNRSWLLVVILQRLAHKLSLGKAQPPLARFRLVLLVYSGQYASSQLLSNLGKILSQLLSILPVPRGLVHLLQSTVSILKA